MKTAFRFYAPISLLLVLLVVQSCKKEVILEVIAGFSYAVDASDFKKVTFTNASTNYVSVSWNFGDNTAASTEEKPVHTYAAIGNYTVTLTATASDGSTDVTQQTVAIVDPNAELTKLVGDVSKTWKLLRVPGTSAWPLEVGPIARDQVWWAQGRDNDEIALRPCIMNDEFTFTRSGSFVFDNKGDFWAEGGVFEPANVCQTANAANMKGANGIDLSAFGSATHKFRLVNGAKPTLTVIGKGAYIGLPKIGTDAEVKVPQDSVTLDIVRLTDGAVDTLILESAYKWDGNTSGKDDAYWRIVLVHYDNASAEPPIPSPKPVVGFTVAAKDLTVTLTNTTKFANSYSWNFGDGTTSTQESPTHTYAAAGSYKIVLSATNSAGTVKAEQEVTVTSGSMTVADLVGSAWKIRNAANSITVGPGLGNSSWWQVPANFMDGSSTGGDDWSCIVDDEFIFSADGTYEYRTKGTARNDGYMGSPNGCWSDAQVAASGNGAAFGSGKHTFTFTPASGDKRPIITVKNGASGAAFIGFYKGFYGGENTNSANPPNGGASTNRYEVISYLKAAGKETLTISVDISGGKDGSAAWNMVLVR
ncbi:MAG: PKD domain-containing protein [Haliscomenobacter sp.]